VHKTKEEILSEIKIIIEARKNPDKFELLYEQYYSEIFKFIFYRTSNKDITEDICSQVFLKAMLNLKSYTFKGIPFSAWLYRIAINEINLYFRKTKKIQTTTITSEILQTLTYEIIDNENEVKINRILISLKKLKEKHLKLIELRYFDKKSFREIGEILNLTENNAKTKVYRALDALKKIIEKNG
jgi:RNA polymerase sigma-70 factor (ECF subfamily)